MTSRIWTTAAVSALTAIIASCVMWGLLPNQTRDSLEFADSAGKLRIRISAKETSGSLVMFADDGSRILLDVSDTSRIALLSPTNEAVALLATSKDGTSFLGFGPAPTNAANRPDLYKSMVWPEHFTVILGCDSQKRPLAQKK